MLRLPAFLVVGEETACRGSVGEPCLRGPIALAVLDPIDDPRTVAAGEERFRFRISNRLVGDREFYPPDHDAKTGAPG